MQIFVTDFDLQHVHVKAPQLSRLESKLSAAGNGGVTCGASATLQSRHEQEPPDLLLAPHRFQPLCALIDQHQILLTIRFTALTAPLTLWHPAVHLQCV